MVLTARTAAAYFAVVSSLIRAEQKERQNPFGTKTLQECAKLNAGTHELDLQAGELDPK
jgi:hypothetical protein